MSSIFKLFRKGPSEKEEKQIKTTTIYYLRFVLNNKDVVQLYSERWFGLLRTYHWYLKGTTEKHNMTHKTGMEVLSRSKIERCLFFKKVETNEVEV